MTNTLRAARLPHFEQQAEFSAKLSIVHAGIERTFLAGGEVLVSVMEIVNGLIAILDSMSGTMDGQTAENAIAGLRKTIDDLVGLPETEEGRLAGFEELAVLCSSAEAHIEEIHQTIRYLRTFAVTVKITGAGLTEFAEFADEIRDRIQSGADEVGKFAEHLVTMRKQLGTARAFSSNTKNDFNSKIPQIISSLSENSQRISREHQEMADTAAQVKKIAQGVQGKVGAALSSLQIGDITRQRIEHVQSMLSMVDDYSQSAEAHALGDHALASVCDAVNHLASAQMEETAIDFRKECRKIFLGISSFTKDAARILSLRDDLVMKSAEGNVLALIEKDIASACELASRLQASSAEADAVVRSVTQSAQHLLRGITVLRAIKTDIHYMALNSNLRCSKLGDEGRSVNVVSAELRNFAEKLETPADAIVENLQRVEAETESLIREGTGFSGDLSEPLGQTLVAINSAKLQMEAGMDALSREGQAVFNRISAAVVKLDFEDSLGAALDECGNMAAALATGVAPDVSSLDERVIPFAMSIYKLYTMAQEREIHTNFLPFADKETPVSMNQTGSASDEHEDAFADALF